MISGNCHCGAIQYRLAVMPEWLTRCTCSYCRRAGALWAHGPRKAVSLTYDPAEAVRYVWGDRTLAFITCKTCGCTTHWENLDPAPDARMAVNGRMADPDHISHLPVRTFDGAGRWQFID